MKPALMFMLLCKMNVVFLVLLMVEVVTVMGLKVVMIVANKKARTQHLKVENVFESHMAVHRTRPRCPAAPTAVWHQV